MAGIGILVPSFQGSRAEVLKVRSELVPFSLSVCSPPATSAFLPQRVAVLDHERLEWAVDVGQGAHWGSPSTLELQTASDLLSPRMPVMVALTPFRCSAGSELALSATAVYSTWLWQPSP